MKVSKRLKVQLPKSLAIAFDISPGQQVKWIVLQGNLTLIKDTE